jgi:hypothetical protein
MKLPLVLALAGLTLSTAAFADPPRNAPSPGAGNFKAPAKVFVTPKSAIDGSGKRAPAAKIPDADGPLPGMKNGHVVTHGLGPVRTIRDADARTAVREQIAKDYGMKNGIKIRLKSDGPAADRFTAVGPQGKMGLRFSEGGTVTEGPGKTKATVTQKYLNKM